MTRDRSDPVIYEIREIRHRISADLDHDPARLVAYYMELQKRHRDRFIDAPHTGGAKSDDGLSEEEQVVGASEGRKV